MKKTLVSALGLMLLCMLLAATAGAEARIQLAILLDTSGSMDGLIEQAKTQLWKIVNELARAKQNGESPLLEVALYEYGKDSIPAANGYMRMILPLSRDLDKISEELFALKTDGGSEYCGMAIKKAVTELSWNADSKTLKVIFIAGNEEFTQGDINFRDACKQAITSGIVINTIFCGNREEGISTNWKEGADMADGFYMTIDQDQTVAYIEAPQDAEITRLGNELNKTYVGYGVRAEEGTSNQTAQDGNAASASPEAAVQRSMTKATAQYDNSGWDLVDAVASGAVDVSTMKKDQLPAELQGKTEDEVKAYVEEKSAEREAIQKRITQLSGERRVYVENEMKKQGESNTFDAVVITALHDLAEKKQFAFGEE
ncbi:MAG: VWA domain-containing protein [Spirochaetaceae bacterium]|nr:MAG: VWA domain-containing protein [Spirochaetaceae bacterium]